MRDVTIVGGGPAGSLAAADLARDHDVLVLEEHESSGRPVQCAGLISDEVIRMSGVRPDILNTLHGAEVVFPDGRSVTVRSEWPKARVVDRADLDSRMADAAMSAGAEFSYSERYISHTVTDRVEVTTSRGSHASRAIIGADGHSSKVAMSLGDNGPREYIRGIQADVDVPAPGRDLFRIHLGSRYAPGFFTWEIPCGDFIRVGLCTSWSAGPPMPYLKRLLSDNGYDGKVMRMYSGKIPIGGRRVTYGDRCLLTGDAAGLVKPISGGGLFPTFKATPILCGTLRDALASDDLSAASLSGYERGWRAELGKGLDRGYTLRKLFCRLDDGDLTRAGKYASREDVRSELDQLDLDDPAAVVKRIMCHGGALLAAIPLGLRCLI